MKLFTSPTTYNLILKTKTQQTWIKPEYGFWLESKASAVEIVINPDDGIESFTFLLGLSS
jgi:hypothetical protein